MAIISFLILLPSAFLGDPLSPAKFTTACSYDLLGSREDSPPDRSPLYVALFLVVYQFWYSVCFWSQQNNFLGEQRETAQPYFFIKVNEVPSLTFYANESEARLQRRAPVPLCGYKGQADGAFANSTMAQLGLPLAMSELSFTSSRPTLDCQGRNE